MKIKDEEIRVNISRTKTIIHLIIAIGLLMTLIWFVILVFTLTETTSRTFLITCCSFLIIISTLSLISSVKKLINKSKGIVINDEGIEINIGPNNGHFVKWVDITNIKIHSPIRGPMFLLIFVKNPDYYISVTHGIKRYLLKMNNSSHKTPVSITSNWLDCNFETLVALVTENHKKYNRQRNNKTTTA